MTTSNINTANQAHSGQGPMKSGMSIPVLIRSALSIARGASMQPEELPKITNRFTKIDKLLASVDKALETNADITADQMPQELLNTVFEAQNFASRPRISTGSDMSIYTMLALQSVLEEVGERGKGNAYLLDRDEIIGRLKGCIYHISKEDSWGALETIINRRNTDAVTCKKASRAIRIQS